jgi:hypothetical protein
LTDNGADLDRRREILQGLPKLLRPAPAEETQGAGVHITGADPAGELECLGCSSWADLEASWKDAVEWSSELAVSLAVALAASTSTRTAGDPLWVKMVGPPSSGKSTLCEAMAVNKRYILAKSTITGLHSGYKDASAPGEDCSLLTEAQDKMLIIKDADTLLQNPGLSRILSELRDVYDKTTRTHFKNKTSKNWEGINLTVLLAGTKNIRRIDASELGERFLDVVVMGEIEPIRERRVCRGVAVRSFASLGVESDGKIQTRYAPGIAHAMRLTGGYVGWLRANAQRLLTELASKGLPEWAIDRCTDLGLFVSYLRARPTKEKTFDMEEGHEREFGARLTSQMARLAGCLAVVLNRTEIDAEVMRVVKTVALTTARGKTHDLLKHLRNSWVPSNPQRQGAVAGSLAIWINEGDDKTRTLLRFLEDLDAVQWTQQVQDGQRNGPKRWRQTPLMQELWDRVRKD